MARTRKAAPRTVTDHPTDWPPQPPTELLEAGSIHEKLIWVQNNVHDVIKSGHMSHHNYSYMQEHGLLAIVKPLMRLVALGSFLSLRPEHCLRSGNKTILTGDLHVYDAAGEELVFTYQGEGIDSSDKATGKAYTGLMKYALQKLFQIPTDAIEDNDETPAQETHQPAAEPQQTLIDTERAHVLVKDVQDAGITPARVKAYLTSAHGVERLADLPAVKVPDFEMWIVEEVKKKGTAPDAS